tara:strand:- start:1170 stop:1508 length:339 start_codon:yes stop_codon:yes gene_type:complete
MSAIGKKAYGFCDRTGFRYELKDLVPQIENRRKNGMLVGRDMLDIDQEQLRLSEVNASEDVSLKDPRPDRTLIETRALWAWNPVGGGLTASGSSTVGLDMSGVAGRVTVETT